MARTARPEKFRDRYRLRWIDADGKRRCALFDKYADADKALRRKQTEADQIRTGELLRPPPPKTFNDLADYWDAYRIPQLRSSRAPGAEPPAPRGAWIGCGRHDHGNRR